MEIFNTLFAVPSPVSVASCATVVKSPGSPLGPCGPRGMVKSATYFVPCLVMFTAASLPGLLVVVVPAFKPKPSTACCAAEADAEACEALCAAAFLDDVAESLAVLADSADVEADWAEVEAAVALDCACEALCAAAVVEAAALVSETFAAEDDDAAFVSETFAAVALSPALLALSAAA